MHAPGAKQVPVRAPGDIVIWRLDRVQYSNRPSDDYTLDFEVCRSVRGRFAHVSTLSPVLAAVVAGPGQCQTYTTDPLTFGAVALLLALIAVAASLVPVARAARVDPMEALRRDAA